MACLSEVHLMSEKPVLQDATSQQEYSILNLSTTAGQMLRQARLDAGLHIAALAVSLRVPVKRIEALENGQMDLLPDMVFVRALTSSICQALKIDPKPILDKLPKAALPRLNRDDVAINTPISASKAAKAAWLSEMLSSPLFLGVLFLCAAAAGVYLWPKASTFPIPQVSVSPKALPEVGVSHAKETQVATEGALIPNLSASTGLVANITPATTPIDAVAAVSTTAPASAEIPLAAPIDASLIADNLVTFKATGETWIEVRSAAGSTLFKKLLNAGESAGVSGVLPLTVIVGRADVTQVQVRGKPIDLIPIAKSNVARFEVN
jgi:cytoskeleton protein RodZ